MRRVDLAGTLARLKYAETRETPKAPGQYRRAGAVWEIYLRGAEGAGGQLVRLDTRDERITRVTRGGNDIGAASLEPEILASADDRPGEEHRPVRLADVPLVFLNAILAAEDHRFFEHGGLDPHGLIRAAWTNVRAGRVMQGGSTITQHSSRTGCSARGGRFGESSTRRGWPPSSNGAIPSRRSSKPT